MIFEDWNSALAFAAQRNTVQKMTLSGTQFTDPAGAVSMATLTAPLAPLMARLDVFLESEVDCFEPEVRDLVRYTFSHSGKRLRPILVFFCGWGGAGKVEDLVKAAAIVEMVHLATLVHDDILDGATLRHKAPTLVAKYGAHASVLLGDALFSEALRLAAQYPSTEVCRVVAHATRKVCEGEICQTFRRGDDRISLDSYYRMIELKTAELFRAACRLGAYVGGYDTDFVKAADDYGMHLGTAYQIFDDMADLVGDEASIGKTLGTDLASGKFTMPVLFFLETLSHEARADFVSSCAGISNDDLRKAFAGSDAFARTTAAFDAEVASSLHAIALFAKLPAHEPMRALTQFVGALVPKL
jgi:octaprenyl-diphosphate synthase